MHHFQLINYSCLFGKKHSGQESIVSVIIP